MAGTVDVGTGTTITHGTTSYAAEVLSVSGEITRAMVSTTHMGTVGAITKRPGDLYDAGSITIAIHFDPEEEAPYTSAEETVTVTFPVKTGDSTGATVAGSGAVSQFSFNAGIEETLSASYVVTFTDDLTWTDGSV